MVGASLGKEGYLMGKRFAVIGREEERPVGHKEAVRKELVRKAKS